MLRQRHAPRAGFTLIELLVVIAVIGFLAATLGVLAVDARQRAFDVKTVMLLRRIEIAVQTYVSLYNRVPPACPVGTDVDAGDRYASAGRANYLGSAALHYWLGSSLRLARGYDLTGKATIVKSESPLLDFSKSEVSTWDSMASGGAPTDWPAGSRVAATGEVADAGVPRGGIVLDSWKRGIAYVAVAAAEGNHTATKFPRPGKSFGAAGRNLTGFCQVWSRGLDGVTALPDSGAATDPMIGNMVDGDLDGRADNIDDIALWFLPYY